MMKRLLTVAAVVLISTHAHAEGGLMGSAALSGAGQGLSNASSQMMSIYGAGMLQQQQFQNQQLLMVQNEFHALMSMKTQLDGYATLLQSRANDINRRQDGPDRQADLAAYTKDLAAFEAQVLAYNQRCANYVQWKTSLGF